MPYLNIIQICAHQGLHDLFLYFIQSSTNVIPSELSLTALSKMACLYHVSFSHGAYHDLIFQHTFTYLFIECYLALPLEYKLQKGATLSCLPLFPNVQNKVRKITFISNSSLNICIGSDNDLSPLITHYIVNELTVVELDIRDYNFSLGS